MKPFGIPDMELLQIDGIHFQMLETGFGAAQMYS